MVKPDLVHLVEMAEKTSHKGDDLVSSHYFSVLVRSSWLEGEE